MKIWKHQIPRAARFNTLLPVSAVVLHVGPNRDGTNGEMWVKLDPDAPVVPRTFYRCLTGDEAPVDGVHLGTYMECDGFVVHIFEDKGV